MARAIGKKKMRSINGKWINPGRNWMLRFIWEELGKQIAPRWTLEGGRWKPLPYQVALIECLWLMKSRFPFQEGRGSKITLIGSGFWVSGLRSTVSGLPISTHLGQGPQGSNGKQTPFLWSSHSPKALSLFPNMHWAKTKFKLKIKLVEKWELLKRF